MIKNAIILASLISICIGYMVYTDYRKTGPSSPKDSQAARSEAQFPAPQFSFHDLNGKEHTLADFKGKVIILNFWASWCAPCVIEFPQMVELAKATKDDSVLIFMSVDDNKKDIERFLKKHGKDLPQKNILIGWDKDKSISQGLFQTYRLPETFIVAPDMVITEKIIGADVEWNSTHMQKEIKALASQP